MRDAKKILLKDKFHQIFEEDVVRRKVIMINPEDEKECIEWHLHFVNKKIKYVWDANTLTAVSSGVEGQHFFRTFLRQCRHFLIVIK